MSPTFIFLFGLLILGLFVWYFMTDAAGRKRTIGLVLTILLLAFCIEAIIPPEKKIRLGLDLQGGTSFLLRLVGEGGEEITPSTLDQAIEVIRKRVDQFGVSEPVIAAQGRDRILVQIPGLDTQQLASTKEQLQRVATRWSCSLVEASCWVSSPGICTRMRSRPCAAMTGSLTPNWSTRLRMTSIA